jgi:hypothetical protein
MSSESTSPVITPSSPEPPRAVNSERKKRRLTLKVSDYLAGLALMVATGSAIISFTQVSTVRHQLRLAQLQIRPYIRYQPRFEERGLFDLDVEMRLENFSAIPGKVAYHELRYWVNEKTGTTYLFNRTGDMVYQNKAGYQILPRMPKEMASGARSGTTDLMLGTCVIYAPIDPEDNRRWEAQGLYRFVSGTPHPETQYLNEQTVNQSVDRCDSSRSLSLWKQEREKPTRDGSPGWQLKQTPH